MMNNSKEDVYGIWQILKDGDATVLELSGSCENGIEVKLYFSENQTGKMRSRLAKGDLSALKQDRFEVFDVRRRCQILVFFVRFQNWPVVTQYRIRLRTFDDLENIRMFGSCCYTERFIRILKDVNRRYPIIGDWRYGELEYSSPVFHVALKKGRLSVASSLSPSGECVPVRLLDSNDEKVVFLWNNLSTIVTLRVNGDGCADCKWRVRDVSWVRVSRSH